MNIIGMSVFHKKNGTGYIEELTENKLRIRFPSTAEGEKSSCFQFPNAFAQGFLVSNEPDFNNWIEEEILKRKCSVCGNDGIHTEKINDVYFCSSCKKNHTTKCFLCNELCISEQMKELKNSKYHYSSKKICSKCAEQKTFICSNCNTRYENEMQSSVKLQGQILCNKCFTAIAGTCHFCGNPFILEKGKFFYLMDDEIEVCPDCLPTQTFTCSTCRDRKLIASRINSKYVPASKNICCDCVSSCAICKETIDKSQVTTSFKKNYCPECWNTLNRECPVCGKKFIPEESTQTLCPNCIEMQQYVERIKNIDFKSCISKTINCCDLDYLDRCKLFTQLYENCRSFYRYTDKPFPYLIMHILDIVAVITYLPPTIVGDIKHSKNITMSKLRQADGKFSVHSAISRWLPTSTHHIELPEGKMTILNYPVLLRVQTEYDKNYGKRWDGPYSYIEIHNYGDTTNFHIIGVLQ